MQGMYRLLDLTLYLGLVQNAQSKENTQKSQFKFFTCLLKKKKNRGSISFPWAHVLCRSRLLTVSTTRGVFPHMELASNVVTSH